MWISKKKWDKMEDRLLKLETVLFHVERCSNLSVINKNDTSSGNWGTSAGIRTFLGYSREDCYESVATMFQVLLQKLGLQTERNPKGTPIITEIPKATGGKSGRSK